jgi:hypothetical protein
MLIIKYSQIQLTWVVFDYISLIFYNSIQHNVDVSPESYNTWLTTRTYFPQLWFMLSSHVNNEKHALTHRSYTSYHCSAHRLYIQSVPGGMDKTRESVPYVKIYRYNPKHLCPKLNGYGDKGKRKVWTSCGTTYCTWFAWSNTHTLRIVRPCLQPAQAHSSLRLHM